MVDVYDVPDDVTPSATDGTRTLTTGATTSWPVALDSPRPNTTSAAATLTFKVELVPRSDLGLDEVRKNSSGDHRCGLAVMRSSGARRRIAPGRNRRRPPSRSPASAGVDGNGHVLWPIA